MILIVVKYCRYLRPIITSFALPRRKNCLFKTTRLIDITCLYQGKILELFLIMLLLRKTVIINFGAPIPCRV